MELHNNYITNAFREQNDFFFISFQIELVITFWNAIITISLRVFYKKWFVMCIICLIDLSLKKVVLEIFVCPMQFSCQYGQFL